MREKTRNNYTKKDISNNLSSKIGLSNSYSLIITDAIIKTLKELIITETINIKNFGTFKVLFKKARLGRNPKNKTVYEISARKSLSFIASKKLDKNLNKLV